MHSIRSGAPAFRALVAPAALALCAAHLGCAPIPMGAKVLETKEISRELVTKSDQLASVTVEPRFTEASRTLTVGVKGEYVREQYELVKSNVREEKRYLIVGAFPGTGARWWGGRCSLATEIAEVFVAVPVVNALFLGLPTWGGWFD